jgi:uncharacterized protein YrrD
MRPAERIDRELARKEIFYMELKEGTDVFTASGEQVGKINRFVLDPETNEVTHIVVQKGWLLPEDKLVPIEMIHTATEKRVVLDETVRDLDQLPPFEETHYVEITEDTQRTGASNYRYMPAYYWYPPTGYIGYPGFGSAYHGWLPTETTRNIPSDTVPLEEGANVISSEGEHVGDVERLVVDPESHKATHFIISEGLLFKERRLVPAHWVRSIEEEKVHLRVPTRLLERLPVYET